MLVDASLTILVDTMLVAAAAADELVGVVATELGVVGAAELGVFVATELGVDVETEIVVVGGVVATCVVEMLEEDEMTVLVGLDAGVLTAAAALGVVMSVGKIEVDVVVGVAVVLLVYGEAGSEGGGAPSPLVGKVVGRGVGAC